ncbi:metal ABC transporter permease [Alkalicoccus urumqiensis]|uniref:Metal ABC transporter permease n=1 Tax=Alkalicoccus urumqiensis TaxID=1548213 RepID=A0A2P6MFU6_ALKUR|nr:metal ABC transporter permease [Alkalicoccus urumqiensis]PRO65133.1 metal ABC transporter permease [Alkalicoccus urumqiensis]
MEWIQDWSFLERGLFAGMVIGFLSPVLGAFLFVRRMTIISEGLSHVTLTGITAGLVLMQVTAVFSWLNPLYTGLLAAIFGAFIIERLRGMYRAFEEVSVPILLSAAVGASAVLMSLVPTSYAEWYSYLFGSILTVRQEDVWFTIGVGAVTLLLMLLFYKELLAISFDQEFASVTGVPVQRVNMVFTLLLALVIALSMKIVGILLVGALIILPTAAAYLIAKSFRRMLLLGILFGEASVLGGITASYYLDVATGGMIVVCGLLLFTAALVSAFVRGRTGLGEERIT